MFNSIINLFKRFGAALFHQWQVKIYVFFLAVLLWIFVAINNNYETELDIALETIGLKDNKIITSEIPKTIKVRFSGQGKDLIIARYVNHPVMHLDLQTINRFYDYPLQTNFISIHPNLNLIPQEIIEPDTVKILLADKYSRRVPVIVNAEVEPVKGYMLSHPVRSVPDSVNVTAPRNVLRDIEFVETGPLVFKEVKHRYAQGVELINPSPDVVTYTPWQVQVVAETDRIAERTVKRVIVGATNVPGGRRVIVEPSHIDVILRGPSGLLATMTADSIDAFVNARRYQPGKREYSPEFNISGNVEVIKSVPELVRVRVEVE